MFYLVGLERYDEKGVSIRGQEFVNPAFDPSSVSRWAFRLSKRVGVSLDSYTSILMVDKDP
jgi:hypothetical protein